MQLRSKWHKCSPGQHVTNAVKDNMIQKNSYGLQETKTVQDKKVIHRKHIKKDVNVYLNKENVDFEYI